MVSAAQNSLDLLHDNPMPNYRRKATTIILIELTLKASTMIEVYRAGFVYLPSRVGLTLFNHAFSHRHILHYSSSSAPCNGTSYYETLFPFV